MKLGCFMTFALSSQFHVSLANLHLTLYQGGRMTGSISRKTAAVTILLLTLFISGDFDYDSTRLCKFLEHWLVARMFHILRTEPMFIFQNLFISFPALARAGPAPQWIRCAKYLFKYLLWKFLCVVWWAAWCSTLCTVCGISDSCPARVATTTDKFWTRFYAFLIKGKLLPWKDRTHNMQCLK